MRSNYVRGASITVSASQEEILDMLACSGATGVGCTCEDGRAVVAFSSGGRRFRIVLTLPRAVDGPLLAAGAGRVPKMAQEVARRRWRQLAELIRAKLAAVAAGIVAFDQEFLAYTLTPESGPAPVAAVPGTAPAAGAGS
jgi:hypothetical protein